MNRRVLVQTLIAVGAVTAILGIVVSCGPSPPSDTEIQVAIQGTQLAHLQSQVADLSTNSGAVGTAAAEAQNEHASLERKVAEVQTQVATVLPSAPPTDTPPPPTDTPTPPPPYCCENLNTSSCIPYVAVGDYVGEYACVCCTVPRTNFASGSSGQPTFIDCHDPYQGWFGALIWPENRQAFINRFGGNPEHVFKNRYACFWGLIGTYRGDPQIILRDPDKACIRCG